LIFDSSKEGLNAVLFDWQIEAMKVVWSSVNGAKSRTVHEAVNKKLYPKSISRASIINFLDDMREAKVLSGIDVTGKGGHHWVYSTLMDKQQYEQHIAETLLDSLKRNFPEETREALKKL